MTAITGDGRLVLTLRDPGWIGTRRLDDFVADHDHLMHLFIVSPDLDRFWHLHPDEMTTGTFEQRLPEMPQGRYEVFADLVHATGVPETVTAQLDMPAVRGSALSGDDSGFADARLKARATSGPDNARLQPSDPTALLPDGSRMVWVRDAQPLFTKRLTMFTFRVEDAAGQPARDLELYMGMPGHAIFVRHDRGVFAHVHPSGSAPMAAIAMGQRSLSGAPASTQPTHVADDVHGPHAMSHTAGLPATVSFPYGFPELGMYRIFVQVKRAGRIDTGVFDVHVE